MEGSWACGLHDTMSNGSPVVLRSKQMGGYGPLIPENSCNSEQFLEEHDTLLLYFRIYNQLNHLNRLLHMLLRTRLVDKGESDPTFHEPPKVAGTKLVKRKRKGA